MSTDICLMFAAERSGTHLLRSLLGNAPGVKAPGEIANAAAASSRTADISFLKYRKERWLANPDYFFATRELQNALLEDYFDLVRKTYPDEKFVVLDIKYSHVHSFNAGWWDPASRPFLIEFARKNGIKVIHLQRMKVYRTVISQIYAQESGVWRASEAADIKPVRIEIPRTRLERRANALTQSIGLFERWLSQCDRIKIDYETLTADAVPVLKELAAFLGLDADIPPLPRFVKTTPPYKDSIANYDEIADLIDVKLGRVRRELEADATKP